MFESAGLMFGTSLVRVPLFFFSEGAISYLNRSWKEKLATSSKFAPAFGERRINHT